jgi:OmpA-OmpF porin, OOP family
MISIHNNLIFILNLLCISITQAQTLQNMVRNPSFEQYKQIPNDLGAINQATFVNSPTDASPDYFHKRCQSIDVDVPRNKMGIAEARSGTAYAGIYVYTNRYTKSNFREYLQLELKQNLNKDELYCVKAHVYLAQSSNRALPALAMTASRFGLQKNHQSILEQVDVEIMHRPDKKVLTDRSWVEISCTYKAVGGEKFIAIGNFSLDKDTKITGAIEIDSFRNPNVDFAYYYVDDVCVTSLKYNKTCNCGSFEFGATQSREVIVLDATLKEKTYEVGRALILENVRFDKNKAILQESSFAALDEVVIILKKNPTYNIEISGHTSDKGDAEENHFLSKRRAKSVVDYLIASGINEKRLSYKGFGQSRPVALNDTEENRRKNERVQLLLISK